MFELIIMRHAKSDWSQDVGDTERPLNSRGRKNAAKMAKLLNEKGLVPDLIISSSASRTQETVESCLPKWPTYNGPVNFDKNLYLPTLEALLDVVKANAEDEKRLMIVSHNPGCAVLVNYLASTAPKLSSSGKLMTTSAVAHFQFDSLEALEEPGNCELLALFRPKEI